MSPLTKNPCCHQHRLQKLTTVSLSESRSESVMYDGDSSDIESSSPRNGNLDLWCDLCHLSLARVSSSLFADCFWRSVLLSERIASESISRVRAKSDSESNSVSVSGRGLLQCYCGESDTVHSDSSGFCRKSITCSSTSRRTSYRHNTCHPRGINQEE